MTTLITAIALIAGLLMLSNAKQKVDQKPESKTNLLVLIFFIILVTILVVSLINH